MGKTIKVVNAKAIFTAWAALLILDKEGSTSVFRRKGQGNHPPGMGCVVNGRITQFIFGVRVN
ncbi:MAG: hypothetical protein JWN73_726 [Betaproteobacteria bacterium]|nr:hypothetical protein [Betaproteobacteria bacterium]